MWYKIASVQCEFPQIEYMCDVYNSTSSKV